MVDIIPATSADFAELHELQLRNLYRHLNETDRAAGFISVAWNRDQLEEMVEADAIVVARQGSQLAGYFAIVGALRDRSALDYLLPIVSSSVYAGAPLSSYRLGLGPQICVASDVRGSGIGMMLFTAGALRWREQYDCLLGSVHRENLAGRRFNVNRLGAEVVAADETRRFIVFDLRRVHGGTAERQP